MDPVSLTVRPYSYAALVGTIEDCLGIKRFFESVICELNDAVIGLMGHLRTLSLTSKEIEEFSLYTALNLYPTMVVYAWTLQSVA